MSLTEKRKEAIDKKDCTGAILIELSKAFDTINQELLISKSYAYRFSKDALKLIYSYISHHWQKIKD